MKNMFTLTLMLALIGLQLHAKNSADIKSITVTRSKVLPSGTLHRTSVLDQNITDVYSGVARLINATFPEKNIIDRGLNEELVNQTIGYLTETNDIAKKETKDAQRKQQLDTLFQTILYALNTINTLHSRPITEPEKERYIRDILQKKESIDTMTVHFLWEQNKPSFLKGAMHIFDTNQKKFFENYREEAKMGSPNKDLVQNLFNIVHTIPREVQRAPQQTKNEISKNMSALINKLEQYAYLLEHHSRYKSASFSREDNIRFAHDAANTLKLLQASLLGKEYDAFASGEKALFAFVQSSRNRGDLIFLAEASAINTILTKILAELRATN